MIADFRSKLNFEPKQVQFIEKVYTVKTDHKTGLLLQELFKKQADADTDTKMIKLALGEKQYKELMSELEQAGLERGAENYTENMTAIAIGVMAAIYNKNYEELENQVDAEMSKK